MKCPKTDFIIFLFVLYTMHLKHRNSWPPDVSALYALIDYICGRDTWRKKVVNVKQITNVMKY